MMLAMEQMIADPKTWVDSIFTLIEDPRHLIVVALWFLGFLCKQTKQISDNWIPLILMAASAIFCASSLPWGDPQIAPRAIIYAGLAVLGNRLYRHWLSKWLGTGEDETKIYEVPQPPKKDE